MVFCGVEVQPLIVHRDSATTALAPSCGPAAVIEPLTVSPKSSHRILLVEDDRAVRGCVGRVLVLAGYHVDLAEDGVEGWEAVQRNHYDLLITDNDMPRLTGLELVRRVRWVGMSLLVIMASGSLPREAMEEDPALQFAGKLQKPFAAGELLTEVSRVLALSTAPVEEDGPLVVVDRADLR
jgi:DNA-binding response OmpR family regulator